MECARDGRLVASVDLATSRDVALACRAVSRAMDGMKVRPMPKTRFATAVSEIARNTVLHGGGGRITLHVLDQPRRIRAVCVDQGPGIVNVEQALQDGFSTADGLGKGLGGAKRLVDDLVIDSTPGQGTTIRLTSAV